MKQTIIRDVVLTTSLLMSFLFSFTYIAIAQSSYPIQNIEDTTIEGTIIKRENRVITVRTNDDIKEFSLPSNIRITRNQQSASVQDLRPNDKVNIVLGNNSEILTVDAISGFITQIEELFLPILGALLIIVGTILILLKKQQRGMIRTKPISYRL